MRRFGFYLVATVPVIGPSSATGSLESTTSRDTQAVGGSTLTTSKRTLLSAREPDAPVSTARPESPRPEMLTPVA
jgi:hypothetical protein